MDISEFVRIVIKTVITQQPHAEMIRLVCELRKRTINIRSVVLEHEVIDFCAGCFRSNPGWDISIQLLDPNGTLITRGTHKITFVAGRPTYIFTLSMSQVPREVQVSAVQCAL